MDTPTDESMLHAALVFTALAALATALAAAESCLATEGRHLLALRLTRVTQ